MDEVQREPGLLRAVKRVIDRSRKPGQFLLTGSANLLLMRQVSESLAGRASYLTLWPLTRRKQRGLGQSGRWDLLLDTPDAEWHDALADEKENGRRLARARPARRISHSGTAAYPRCRQTATSRSHSQQYIAGSTCLKLPICSCACLLTR